MRIPLDYYRILGLPIQANDEQRALAYRDRVLQLPRREYSDAAITARKQLLDEAFAILSDPEQREKYNTSFLVKTSGKEPEVDRESSVRSELVSNDTYTTSIEIRDEQFIGALVILHELGEYELVLKLGQPYLLDKAGILEKGDLGDRDLIRADITLTLALTCLELGREQWQQNHYEGAATSLETGQALLLREGLFPSVRGEIQLDAYKLRPYRVLHLLAQDDDQISQRRLGLRLLQEMLQERGGIDGTGEDQSGLSIDDFLRFIQQIRIYLTCSEQQVLFEQEAKRPSAVATYLSVYALIAKGFAQHQPALIYRAKQTLTKLGKRQDVHLETAICSLLLGQTEAASRSLENSQEYEPLAFIREHSEGSPDLLPGLCLYAEKWLQKSVFPHFRDLLKQRVSLKNYFAEQQVQDYLESLPADTEAGKEWTPNESRSITYRSPIPTANGKQSSPDTPAQNALPQDKYSQNNYSQNHSQSISLPDTAPPPPRMQRDASIGGRTASLTIEKPLAVATNGVSNGISSTPPLPVAERVAIAAPGKIQGQRLESVALPITYPPANKQEKFVPHPQPPVPRRRFLKNQAKHDRLWRLIFFSAGSLLVLLLFFYLVAGLIGWLQKGTQAAPVTTLEGEQPLVSLNEPPVPLPTGQPIPAGTLTEASGRQVIQNWLGIKSKALGANYEIDQLANILTENALTRWQRTAQANRADTTYWQYKHNLGQLSVKSDPTKPNEGAIEVQVREEAQFFQNGRLNQAESFDDNLLVRYELVRQEGQWRIRDMRILR
ncbi:MAG: DUF4101 domain-containing protein [Coleofasciculaceae cyanobacterium SM2_1_6]|nr:DUF4101 domain-containing protein [Coleofasciculaceae cyanobacterium SM2_1_6]